MKKIFRHL